PTSTLPAAQRMTADAKESALATLHLCVAAMSPPEVGPFAQPLLRLTMALLEATTTPPCLLGPLLRLLLAVLPAVPLAALGQGFGDLVDLLCGWALEPLVATEDRQLITLILHALRPQWHSHPDLTASLTENMFDDVKAASASMAAAVSAAAAAATTSAEGNTDAINQAAACMQLVQLLCDIFSAASLRNPPLTGVANLEEPARGPPNSIGPQDTVHPQQPTQPAMLQEPLVRAPAGGLQASQVNKLHPQPNHQEQAQLPVKQQQLPQQKQQQLHGPAAMHISSNAKGPAVNVFPRRPRAPPAPPLALTAILPTRPGAATVRHLICLYPRLLAALREVRGSLVSLNAICGGILRLKPSDAESWAIRLCTCVEILADSVGSCVTGIDPRDVDEVWEGLGNGVLGRLAALTLHGQDQGPARTGASQIEAAIVVSYQLSSSPDNAVGTYGAVGAVVAIAAPKALGCYDVPEADPAGGLGQELAGDDVSGSASEAILTTPPNLGQISRTRDRGSSLRLWALRKALEWALSLLSGSADGGQGVSGACWDTRPSGPGPDAEALSGFAVKLVVIAVDQDADAGRRLLVELVLEGQGGSMGICGLRSSPCISSVAAAAKLLQALLSHEHQGVMIASLDWLLEDLRLRLAALQPGIAPSLPSQPFSCPVSNAAAVEGDYSGDASAAVAASFDCAVLQAACQRNLLAGKSLLRVEAAMWRALRTAMSPAVLQAVLDQNPLPRQSTTAPDSVQPSGDALGNGKREVLLAQGESRPGERAGILSAQAQAVSQKWQPLPLSMATSLCGAWSSSAVALIAAVCRPGWAGASAADSASPDSRSGLSGISKAPDKDPQSSIDTRAASAAARTCCGAYLHAIHALQTGFGRTTDVGSSLQLHAVLALQRLVKHSAIVASGALRCEQLFHLAWQTVSAGATSWDARVRTASVDCAVDMVSNVLHPMLLPVAPGDGQVVSANVEERVPLPPLPPPPRAEVFAPLVALAFDALADPSVDSAASAVRLSTALLEAALLTTLRGQGVCGAWVPVWQDSLAVAPSRRVPRVQQVARLLELVFQSSAAQGNVLLRKRIPAPAAGGPGANDDGDAGGRMEALQRLALSMLPAETPELKTPGGERSSAEVAMAPEGRSGAALVWMALQEGAKHMVVARLRTHLGGPTQTLGALERMLQVTYSRLSQERRDAGPMEVGAAGRESAWLVLELVGALERAVAHAAEGHAGRDPLPQPVLAFFAANKKVCEEWFTRGRELFTRIASTASAHHHVVHHGLLRLCDMCGTMRQMLASLAKERGKAGTSLGLPQTDAKGGVTGSVDGSQATAAGALPSAPSANLPPQSPAQRTGGKHLQRRGGAGGETVPNQQPQAQQQRQQQQSSAIAPGAAGSGAAASAGAGGTVGGEEATTAPSAVQQLEANLRRLAFAVVEVLKLVGAALLAMGEADSLQGLHSWAVREFEPLLQGAHLPGASAVAAATASTVADALASCEPGLGGPGQSTPRRRVESARGARGSSKPQKDAFAWLLGLSLQASGSYEQALVSYNAFLAPAHATATPTAAGSCGTPPAQTPSSIASLELAAATQSFVVERVAECYAALTDWSGLQSLVGAFSHTATVEPVVAGWWPSAAASIEHRFRALAAFDTAGPQPASVDAVPGDQNANVLLTGLRALEGAMVAPQPRVAAPAGSTVPISVNPPGLRPSPQDLVAIREATSLELSRLLERLRASAYSEPTGQKELLLQASCLSSVIRALNLGPKSHTLGSSGPWDGLLLPQVLRAAPVAGGTVKAASAGSTSGMGFGLGRALLTPDGGVKAAIVRDVSVAAELLRTVRAGDPHFNLPGTQALSVEHIRAAASTGNWSLGIRLVQGATARVLESEGGTAAGCRAVLSVVHSLLSASSGRLLPGQVVELQLRALLPHLSSLAAPADDNAAPKTESRRASDLDSDDLACALCTLARWMVKAGAAALHQNTPATPLHGPQHHHHPHAHQRLSSAEPIASSRHAATQPPTGSPPGFSQGHLQHGQHHRLQGLQHAPPGFTAASTVGRGTAGSAGALQWLDAADWPTLSSHFQRQLVMQHTAEAHHDTFPSAHLAFLVPEALLQSCYAPAACCLRALQLSPCLARAWKAWGDLLFRATKEHRARMVRSQPPRQPPGGGSNGGTPFGDPASATASSDTSGTWAAVGYGAAAVAYCRYLALSYSHDGAARPEDVLPVLLQLLHVAMRHAAPIEQLLEVQLMAVPPPAWFAITPQLLAQLPGSSGAARRLLGLLLHAVGRAAPSLVLYPAVIEMRTADAAAAVAAAGGGAAIIRSDGNDADGSGTDPSVTATGCASMIPELRALLADLGRSRPRLLADVEVLVAEMERLTVLWDERWAALLAEVEVEIARRAVSLQAEAARVADDASMTAEQRQALLSSRYSTLMAPAVMLLERQLRATAAMPPETPHERWFATSVLPRLRAAAASLRDGAGVCDWARPSQAWAPLRAAAATLARQQRQPLPPMSQLSPRLAALQDSEVPMPGCHADGSASGALMPSGLIAQPPAARLSDIAAASGDLTSAGWGSATVTVASVYSELVALNTKTRPKRVALLGSDGRTYAYLLKGREDLRMDERLMQVLRAINVMLQADPAAACQGLATVRCYSVTPLGPRAGLIQWVPATTSLFGVFREWQTATLERNAAMVTARQEGVAKALAEGASPPPEVEPPPPAAANRPMDLFYSRLVSALQDRGLSSATPRRSWPTDLLRAVFCSLAASAPKQLLARVLWAGGGSAALAWRRQQRYSRSLAVMSCVGYLLGLGDRHPDNILLEGREAGVVHIDYNVCWEKGAKLRVPEVVPFRLTQMLRTALGVGGLEGVFRTACEATFGCLRRHREALVGLADAVLSDPGVDWAVEREEMAARQDMELAVALNLFVSRAEEAQRQLQQAEEELPAVLEGPVGVLLSYMEAQVFAEAMRNASTEAQQRIQEAKSALEAAKRAETEASAIVAAAAQEAASLAAEGNALSNAVPQLLQQCGDWAQQHAGTLGVLRDGSFLEGTLASGASWRAVESGCVLGLLGPVQGPGHAPLAAAAPLALMSAIMGGDSIAIGQLPEELLHSCYECDRQAADVLGNREAALNDAVGALTQYGTIVRKLLPPSYPASSYHHRWAQALAALAAGGLSMPAVAQAQALAPREPRPLDVATAWQALRGAQRLATAAAIVLAPGSPDAAVAMSGYVAGVRVSGRELAGAVAAAGKAFGNAMAGVVVEAQERQAAAATTSVGRTVNPVGLSVPHLTRGLVELLQRHIPARPKSELGAPGDEAGHHGVSASTSAAMAASSTALLKLVRAANGRVEALGNYTGQQHDFSQTKEISGGFAALLQDFLRVRGEVAGLAAVTAALAGTELAAPVLGVADLAFGASCGDGSASPSLLPHPYHYQHHRRFHQGDCPSPYMISGDATPDLCGDNGANAARCPLPWLSAAADACGRWPELMQCLAADVAPELAGQLHVGSGSVGAGDTGGGGMAGSAAAPPNTPIAQAAADLRALLRPIEESLQAGRDAHTRLGALAELTATYHGRRAELVCRLTGNGANGSAMLGDWDDSPALPSTQLTTPERESLEADLRALDAAWASRDAVAAGLSAAAAMATDALVVALRGLYTAVLGPGRVPIELQTYDAAAAMYVSASGVEGWAEAGSGGHVAVAAMVAWWDAVTESLEGIRQYDDGKLGGAGGGSAALGPAGSHFGVPPMMWQLYRCVEVAQLVEQSLRTCGQALRLVAPAGTDGALADAYSIVMQVLTRQATEHAASRMSTHFNHFLTSMEAHLTASLEHCKPPTVMDHSHDGSTSTGAGSVEAGDGGAAGSSSRTVGADWDKGAPDLVPFTDFDPGVAGEGEVLGGLEDEDDKAPDGSGGSSDDNAAWFDYDDEPGHNGGGLCGDDDHGYDLDLGLDLDLDDGFGDGSEDVEERRGGGFDGTSHGEGSGRGPDSDMDSRQGRRRVSKAQPPIPSLPEEVSTLVECLAACAAAAAVASGVAAIDPASQPPAMAFAITWAAGAEARAARAARLQRLAAYEWMHEHHLLQVLPTGDPRIGQALAQFFAAQAADPLQPSARVTSASRLSLLTQLQSALDALPQLEQAVSGWEASSNDAVSQVVAVLRTAPERYPVDTALAAQRAGMLMGRRQQWLGESRGVVMRVCQVSEALLQFEYSRQGITWSSGTAAVADGFATHCQLLGRAEVLATLAAGGSEAGRAAAVAEASQRATEAARQAADARYALEVAQYEEVAASSQLQAHLPQLVARSLDLAEAVAESESVVKGLVHLLSNKLGPALKELSSVTAQHSAASDVASVTASVAAHYKRSYQAVEALAAVLPSTLASLTAADAASPLPVEMATEVGFLSAQLLGGPAAAAETRKRAMALLQHMTAPTAALQPVAHTVLELPRALGQLRNELNILAAAAGSIAAAVESKHLLPVLDEQPQQQVQEQGRSRGHTPPQVPSAGASDTPSDTADGTQSRTAADAEVIGTSQTEALGQGGIAPEPGICAAKAASVTPTSTAGTGGLVRLPLQRLVHAAAADHLQHHRSRRSAANEARRRAFAASALRRFIAKLEGRESEGAAAGLVSGAASAASAQQQHLSVSDQVDLLVRQATSVDRLSQMYEGWTAWL
ncbi:hypothetical protein Vretifemale_5200, partial [Volvox reticuliferus]